MIAGAVGVPILIVIVLLATSLLGSGDGDGNRRPAGSTATTQATVAVDPAWDRSIAEVFRPLGAALPTYARAVDDWSNGDLSDAALASTLDEVEPVIGGVASNVTAIPPHRSEDRAGELVTGAAELYVHAVSAHRAALTAADDSVGAQWDRLGRRLRILGDRTFDRARELTTPPIDAGAGVELRLPAEVPDFDRLEMGVGPPLEPEDLSVADALPRAREADREAQPLADWQEAVEGLDAPTPDDVRSAVDDPDRLAGLARRLVTAAEELRDEPVPAGDRGRADRLATGWLVLADAARAGQLVLLAGTPSDVPDALLGLVRSSGLSEP